MQKFLEMRFIGEFFEGAPILLAGFVAKLFSHGGEIKAMLLLDCGAIVIVRIIMPVVRCMA